MKETKNKDNLIQTVYERMLNTYGEHGWWPLKRIFSRLGICSKNIDYHQLQKLITEELPFERHLFRLYHALIVQHAKVHCMKKPVCTACVLADICQYSA